MFKCNASHTEQLLVKVSVKLVNTWMKMTKFANMMITQAKFYTTSATRSR